jgi:nucleoside 2-deoxyribosyltransferase
VKLVYVAGLLFSTHERWYLERVAQALEAAGYRTFLPHHDAGLVTRNSDGERTRIFHTDIEALKSCDLCVALLTGPDHDSGTSAEPGYLYALGKPCIGITDDKRGYLSLASARSPVKQDTAVMRSEEPSMKAFPQRQCPSILSLNLL